jgi:hypothetical protein
MRSIVITSGSGSDVYPASAEVDVLADDGEDDVDALVSLLGGRAAILASITAKEAEIVTLGQQLAEADYAIGQAVAAIKSRFQ